MQEPDLYCKSSIAAAAAAAAAAACAAEHDAARAAVIRGAAGAAAGGTPGGTCASVAPQVAKQGPMSCSVVPQWDFKAASTRPVRVLMQVRSTALLQLVAPFALCCPQPRMAVWL